MTYPDIVFHGATRGVTGSCHELKINDSASVLIDCGLFQGEDERSPEVDFPVAQIRALILTHAHLDHAGRIPYLLAAGFSGPVYSSHATAKLLPLLLEDALHVGVTNNRRIIEQILDRLQSQLVAVDYNSWTTVCDNFRFKLKQAGHILGSAYVECDLAGQRIVFSGDLGAPYAPLLPAPKSPYRADVLILESTYGDRIHEDRKERRLKLKQIIEKALANRGVLLIPAFSIGRTQELLYELEDLIYRGPTDEVTAGLPWEDLEIIVDSPLACRFTDVFRDLSDCWDAEARRKSRDGRHPLSFEQLTAIDSHQDHLNTVAYLQRSARPCIVIAASGMCNGGRIVSYLKVLISDPRTDILFVGYQAQGTTGRAIQQYGPKHGYVVLDSQRYTIAAGIHTISGYSAHADQDNLINFVRRMRHQPETIYLVHGDVDAKINLKAKLEDLPSQPRVIIP